jgi:hypothetical protein
MDPHVLLLTRSVCRAPAATPPPLAGLQGKAAPLLPDAAYVMDAQVSGQVGSTQWHT